MNKKYILRKNIQKNTEILFIFGDNDERKGLGGMAKEFRGELNTAGIRTKKAPSNNRWSFYTDKEFTENCGKIREDIDNIIEKSKNYVGVEIPDGIGQGLADLSNKAPKTNEFLKSEIERLIDILQKRNKKGQ